MPPGGWAGPTPPEAGPDPYTSKARSGRRHLPRAGRTPTLPEGAPDPDGPWGDRRPVCVDPGSRSGVYSVGECVSAVAHWRSLAELGPRRADRADAVGRSRQDAAGSPRALRAQRTAMRMRGPGRLEARVSRGLVADKHVVDEVQPGVQTLRTRLEHMFEKVAARPDGTVSSSGPPARLPNSHTVTAARRAFAGNQGFLATATGTVREDGTGAVIDTHRGRGRPWCMKSCTRRPRRRRGQRGGLRVPRLVEPKLRRRQAA